MSEDEVRAAAEALVSGADLRGHKLKFVEAKQQDRFPGQWTVLFDVFSPCEALIDGPAVVMVDDKGTARFAQAA